jgi:hypothetical protein
VIRLCLGLGVTAVFAPPRETGFQAVVESFNARWQAKVWQRFHFDSLAALQSQSAKYAIAYRQCARLRIEAAPRRRLFARSWKLNLQARLMGCIIYLRRTDAHGWVSLLGHTFMSIVLGLITWSGPMLISQLSKSASLHSDAHCNFVPSLSKSRMSGCVLIF